MMLRVLFATLLTTALLFATPIKAGDRKVLTNTANMQHEGKKAAIQNLRARTEPPPSPKSGSAATPSSSKR